MPTRPPQRGSAPVPQRKSATGTPRLRGRKAVTQRERRLAAEPLCRHCLSRGRVAPATVPDHIVPLHKGGSDDDSNIQCLCADCHAVKTALDMGHRPRSRSRIGPDGWPIEGG